GQLDHHVHRGQGVSMSAHRASWRRDPAGGRNGYHAAVRPVSRPIAAAVLACLAAGCGKPLEDGTYAFEVRSITQDSCSATPVDELLLPDARVETAGETVQISFSAAGPL